MQSERGQAVIDNPDLTDCFFKHRLDDCRPIYTTRIFGTVLLNLGPRA